MKNIYLAYILIGLKSSFFWLGIWILYYLRLTDYRGIGLIETVMIITSIVAEIPTGAVADLLGRKKTLIIAFLLMGIGQIYMGYAGRFADLLYSVLIISAGHAFFSGTLDALVYDSLKSENKENIFDKITSNMNSIGLIVLAISSVIGGLLYKTAPSLPYILNGIACLIGIPVALFLTEPKIDSEKFNLSNYIKQLRIGAQEIVRSNDRQLIFFLLVMATFAVITFEVLDGALLVEYGLSSKWLGIVGAIMALTAALSAQMAPKLIHKLSISTVSIVSSLLYGISLIAASVTGWLGTTIVVTRNNLETVQNTLNSIAINRSISSKNRATTLSTFSMIKSLPYAFVAVAAGTAMEKGSIQFSMKLGWVAVAIVLIYLLMKLKSRKPLRPCEPGDNA